MIPARRIVRGLLRRRPTVQRLAIHDDTSPWGLLVERLNRVDSRTVAVTGFGASVVLAGVVLVQGRRVHVEYASFHRRFAEYRWIQAHPTVGSHLSAWTGYGLHQLASWACIYAAQQQHPAYRPTMRSLNWVTIGVHAAFIVLHAVQTQIWYDGLAQDVPEMTSLGSVSFMLMLILVLESPRRGLILGSERIQLRREFVDLVRRYHGYIFSWAMVYTFWFHPMEGKPGHLVGFGYMFLLLLQSALPYTYAHVDRRWTFVLEFMVLPHAVVMAIVNRNQLSPMFFFGFLGMVLLAQMHGFPLTRRAKLAAYASYLAAATATFAYRGELRKLPSITHIPLLEYGVVALLYALFLGGLRLRQLGRRS